VVVIDDPAAPTPPPCAIPPRREPILLHEGALELRHDALAIEAEGRIELELVPSLRVRFVMPDASVAAPVTGPSTLFVPAFRAKVPVFVTNVSLGRGTIKGSLQPSSAGASLGLAEIRFFVANLPDFMGDPLCEVLALPSGGSQPSIWAGRVVLAAQDWRVILDERGDYNDVYARLNAEGGFDTTHTGSLRRVDGEAFSDTEASEMLNALAGFLGLVSGAWATPVAAIGLDGGGKVVWREWNPRWTSPWSSRLCAFDRLKHDLSGAFAGYVERWLDAVWNEPLRISTQMYVEANGPITADTTLVLGQTLLELIAWVRFVDELQTHSPADFDHSHLKASERLRELLAWIGISPAIPTSLSNLDQEATHRGWADGPHAITEMRNSLVHPRHRQRLTATPVHARIDLQELVLWYAELALLRIIDYQGGYANRLGDKWAGVVENVPWH
jgi:hypothetical protein